MFAVETKHGQKNSQMKKREKYVCTQNFVLREQDLQVASVTEI